jgi:hypothetical protein
MVHLQHQTAPQHLPASSAAQKTSISKATSYATSDQAAATHVPCKLAQVRPSTLFEEIHWEQNNRTTNKGEHNLLQLNESPHGTAAAACAKGVVTAPAAPLSSRIMNATPCNATLLLLDNATYKPRSK